MKTEDTRIWVLVIGILLILGISAFLVVSAVQQGVTQARQAIQPVNDLTGGLATQVNRFLNPTPTILPDPLTIINQVTSLARLETIQYSVEKVIAAESGQGPFGFLFGDRLLLVAHGEVIAGIDLSKLQAADLELRGGALYVTLPEPEIFIATLDNSQTYVYDRDQGILTHGDINLETLARQAAEEEIRQAALEDGILDQALTNAQNYLERLFNDLGYETVIFIVEEG
jgi:hypothetical protein